jgi:hypothetical protein
MNSTKLMVFSAGAMLVVGVAAVPEPDIVSDNKPVPPVTAERQPEVFTRNATFDAAVKRKHVREHHLKALSDRAKRLRIARAERAKEAAERKQAAERARLTQRATRTVTVRSYSVPYSNSMGTTGSNQALGKQMAAARGWTGEQWPCLRALWSKESGWRTTADNPSSSAYGIPQALPGSKMSSAGADWRTNPATQIKWGLGYIAGRYGTPCGAWSAFQSKGWY